MSSSPLISHHLFVAAVKPESVDGGTPSQVGPDAAEIRAREIKCEIVDLSRPSPLESCGPSGDNAPRKTV
jgi:hypothetical protein